MAAAPPAVPTSELSQRYGEQVALARLTMTVPRGEAFGFLGPNGAGKTTAVKLLLGLAPATSGEGWVLGRPLGDRAVRIAVKDAPTNRKMVEILREIYNCKHFENIIL